MQDRQVGDSGGRARPTTALPTVVMVDEPATASSTMNTVTAVAMMVLPTGVVNPVSSRVLVSVRSWTAWSSTGRSKPARPSSTSAYICAPTATRPVISDPPTRAVTTSTDSAETTRTMVLTRRANHPPNCERLGSAGADPVRVLSRGHEPVANVAYGADDRLVLGAELGP